MEGHRRKAAKPQAAWSRFEHWWEPTRVLLLSFQTVSPGISVNRGAGDLGVLGGPPGEGVWRPANLLDGRPDRTLFHSPEPPAHTSLWVRSDPQSKETGGEQPSPPASQA
jgi:hypothetical protein